MINSNMKYGVIKLISGEELISQYEVTEDHKLLLTNPVVIHRQTTSVGPMLACSHWLLFNKRDSVAIKSDRVVALLPDLEDNALRHYLDFVQRKEVVASPEEIKQEEAAYARLERKLRELTDPNTPDWGEEVAEANTTIH